MLTQFNRDVEDLLILIGCGAAFLAVFPFAIYRLFMGELELGVVDSIISIILATVFLQTLRDKRMDELNMLLAVSYMGGLFAVLHLKGPELLYWTYPAIAATYFLLPVRIALPMNVLCILATVPILLPQVTSHEIVSIYPTLVLLCLFGYIFSLRAEYQKHQLSLLATEDGLTHVENRRALDERLDEIIANHSRISQPTSLLILDLDHFKKVNDTHGHTMGDKVLVNFADLIKSTIRITDRLYRFGGEEFVVIANNTTLENAGKLGDYLRELIQTNPGLAKYDITVSIGVAEISDVDDRDSWLHRADVALYEAKAGGRNITYLAKPDKKVNTYIFEPFTHFSSPLKKRRSDSVVSLKPYLDTNKSAHKTKERLY